MASYRLGYPVTAVYRAVAPVLLVMIGGVLLITYWPALSTWLPGLFARG
jgi:TRAP-type C4-dicarboxylate transport system permease large subunit